MVPFLSIFGHFIGAHFGTRSAKEGARWAQESHQELQRAKKLHFKKLKKPKFFSVFGSRGFPREPQEAREGSQETPKEIPKVVQNLVKNWSKSEPKNEQNKLFPRVKISLWPAAFFVVFVAMGPSKNAYFEDVFKMPKNCARCLKTVPKWFKNGSRLPKLFKIAPKIRPYKDS